MKMINPDYSLDEIENRFFNYLSGRVGNFIVVDHFEQLSGGWEAYLYSFKISGIPGYEDKMVLRLFPGYSHEESETWQAMIHNLLHEEGVPVPKVYLSSSDKSILGGAFLVMDFIEGEAVDPADDPNILVLTAKTQAMLHLKNGTRISEKIRAKGHSLGSHTFDGRMAWLVKYAKKYPYLQEVSGWVIDNRPPEPEIPRIIHGDFHPMNLLFKDGEVQAILDWSGFMVGDPMYGLGWTKALFIATAKHEYPEDVFDKLLSTYTESYESINPIDNDKVDYYVAYRLVRALIEGKEGQEVWTKPEIVGNIVKELKQLTGIHVEP